jgi:hypothetical protein
MYNIVVRKFKVLPHLTLNFNGPKSIISALNFLHLGFSSVQRSNALPPEDTSTGGFHCIL